MERLGIRPGLDSTINAAEAVKESHDISLRIEEAQENPIPFEEMRVSKWGMVRSNVDRLKRSRTLRWSLGGHERIEKVARSGQE
jgi:hypothetical protein